jgi:hypothetical protein
MTNLRIKSVLIVVALLAVAPSNVTPASAASFSPLTCFVPSGVTVTTGGAIKNSNLTAVTVNCPIDKGDSVGVFTWYVGYDDTTDMQTKCTYRRFNTANPNVVDASSEVQYTPDSLMGRGWLTGTAVAGSSYYHDIKCTLAPGHSITALVY